MKLTSFIIILNIALYESLRWSCCIIYCIFMTQLSEGKLVYKFTLKLLHNIPYLFDSIVRGRTFYSAPRLCSIDAYRSTWKSDRSKIIDVIFAMTAIHRLRFMKRRMGQNWSFSIDTTFFIRIVILPIAMTGFTYRSGRPCLSNWRFLSYRLLFCPSIVALTEIFILIERLKNID